MSSITYPITKSSKPAISDDFIAVCLFAALGLIVTALTGVTPLIG
jgi:hypothetical protein